MSHAIRCFGSRFGMALIATLATATGCDETDGFSAAEWAQIERLEPLKGPMPRAPYNDLGDDDAVAKLGQMLSFDKDVGEAIVVAGPSGAVGEIRKVSCMNCHDTKYFTDSHLTPGVSHGRTWTGTNVPPMTNVAWYEWALSGGRFDSLMDHGSNVWGTSATPLAQARFLYRKYQVEWDETFPEMKLDPRLGIPTTDPTNVYPATGGPKASPAAADGPFEKMPADAQEHIHQIRARLSRAFETYPRKLVTPDSPFQKYVRDRDYAALSPQAKSGLKLFIGKAACNDCHNGPTLTDNKFHNIGAPSQIRLPGATMDVAPGRGRAGSMQTLIDQLNRSETERTAAAAEGRAEKEWVFHGASRFSDNRDRGLERLKAVKDEDAVKCTMRNDTTGACLMYDETLEGAFRTSSLLNIAGTAPYFHGGLVLTLEDAVRFYNDGGGVAGTFVGVKSAKLRPLHLTETEIRDVVEFLKSLTGVAPIDDPRAPLDGSGAWNWGKNTAKPPLPPDPPPPTP